MGYVNDEKTTCPDCAVAPGARHEQRCDVARCSECGRQYLGCDCRMSQPTVWTGEWPGILECREFNLYTEPGSYWGVMEDLNTLVSSPAFEWDRSLERYVRRATP